MRRYYSAAYRRLYFPAFLPSRHCFSAFAKLCASQYHRHVIETFSSFRERYRHVAARNQRSFIGNDASSPHGLMHWSSALVSARGTGDSSSRIKWSVASSYQCLPVHIRPRLCFIHRDYRRKLAFCDIYFYAAAMPYRIRGVTHVNFL